jgi:hypothetical protein
MQKIKNNIAEVPGQGSGGRWESEIDGVSRQEWGVE